MIYTIKNNAFRLLAALVLGTLIVTFISVQYNNKHPQQAMNYLSINDYSTDLCPERFKNHVDHLMTQTWHELETNTGITLDDCKDFLIEFEPELKSEIEKSNRRKLKRTGTVSASTKALIHEILIDFDIDPKSIMIIAYNGNGSPAAADDYTIYIDEQDLRTFCPDAQRFVIAHEIAHMKNKDHSVESALENLVDPKNKSQRRYLHSFARSSEFRADINAMLKGSPYAKGGISFFQTLIDRYGDDQSTTHPRPSERLKIAQDMHAMHELQVEQYPVGAVAA